MKNLKRAARAALAALLMLALLVPTALCAGTGEPAEDPGDCSLALSFKPEEQVAKGIAFKLYRVADVFPEVGKFQALHGYHVLEGEGTWAEKAKTLKGYVERDSLEPTAEGVTDEQGVVSFSGLKMGIYLVLGDKTGDLGGKEYTPAPVLLTLPAFDEEASGWVTKDLNANIKSYEFTIVRYPPAPENKIIAVEIRWDDNNDAAGKRPGTLKVQLVRGSEVLEEHEVKPGEDWTWSWTVSQDDGLEVRIVDADRNDLKGRGYTTKDTVERGENKTTFVFTNIYRVDIGGDDPPPLDPGDDPPSKDDAEMRVLKVWEDDNDAAGVRPDSVTVDLLGDGEIYDTVELSAGSNWRHTWTGLDKDTDWEVVEREMANYTVSVTNGGVTSVITNTYSAEITDDKPPLVDLDDPDVPKDPDPGPQDPGTQDPTVPVEPGEVPLDPGAQDPTVPVEPGQVPLEPGFPPQPVVPSVPADVQAPLGTDIPNENPPLEMLPQTGLLWWPVPILAVLGVALILLGCARRRRVVR